MSRCFKINCFFFYFFIELLKFRQKFYLINQSLLFFQPHFIQYKAMLFMRQSHFSVTSVDDNERWSALASIFNHHLRKCTFVRTKGVTEQLVKNNPFVLTRYTFCLYYCSNNIALKMDVKLLVSSLIFFFFEAVRHKFLPNLAREQSSFIYSSRWTDFVTLKKHAVSLKGKNFA